MQDFHLMSTVAEDAGFPFCSLFLSMTLHHVMMTVVEKMTTVDQDHIKLYHDDGN